jgi:hypothetical protein
VTAPLDPRTEKETSTTWWEDEGRRIAAQLRDVNAVLIVGSSAEFSARVALGIARAESERRHVALGDLTGDAAPLYAVAGGEDAFGLTDCLRQGLPLNDIARPAPDRESLFILPAGSPPVACAEIIAHERWPKLVNGFTQAGALLMLVVPVDAPGIMALAAATGGVVLVDVPAVRARRLNVIAAVAAPERVQNELRSTADRGRQRKALMVFATVLAVGAAAWFSRKNVLAIYRAAIAKGAAPPISAARSPDSPAARSAAMPPAVPKEPTDTIQLVRLTDPVNPADTSTTAAFAVEVMAANTLAGANSFLADNAKSTARNGATVSPVTVGGSASVWYKVVVGASHDRAGADSLLAAMRREKVLRSGEGRVVKVPYALLVADKIEQSSLSNLHDTWQQRGFNTYVLVQKDGSSRLCAGAFETTAQAASLASALRAAGVAPMLVYRTGRTY